jgi:hypothetical protein
MGVALLLFAVPICIADLGSFIIPNIYLKILMYFALINLFAFGMERLHNVIVWVVLLTGLSFLGIGMGDIKLIALILITHTLNAIDLIGGIFLLAIVHIGVLMGFQRRVPTKIALAPSIFVGFITYMATR